MKLTKEEQEIIKAVELLGSYYGYEFDHGQIIIYTNLYKLDSGELEFVKE